MENVKIYKEKKTQKLLEKILEIISIKNICCKSMTVSWETKSISNSASDSLTTEVLTPSVEIFFI